VVDHGEGLKARLNGRKIDRPPKRAMALELDTTGRPRPVGSTADSIVAIAIPQPRDAH
jgi:hypothetical protein